MLDLKRAVLVILTAAVLAVDRIGKSSAASCDRCVWVAWL